MEPVIVIMASSFALGFIAGYGVRSVVSHHHRTQSRRRLRMWPFPIMSQTAFWSS